MEQVEFDKRIADLIAHRTPEDMARDLLLLQERHDKLQNENDTYLFGGPEARQRMHEAAGTEPQIEPTDVPRPPSAPIDDPESVDDEEEDPEETPDDDSDR
jgi:hypothetical protein